MQTPVLTSSEKQGDLQGRSNAVCAFRPLAAAPFSLNHAKRLICIRDGLGQKSASRVYTGAPRNLATAGNGSASTSSGRPSYTRGVPHAALADAVSKAVGRALEQHRGDPAAGRRRAATRRRRRRAARGAPALHDLPARAPARGVRPRHAHARRPAPPLPRLPAQGRVRAARTASSPRKGASRCAARRRRRRGSPARWIEPPKTAERRSRPGARRARANRRRMAARGPEPGGRATAGVFRRGTGG